MNKLMIAVACGALFAQNAVFGQAFQDPQLQTNAANAQVQAELDQPDGVAITIKPNGTFQIFARGTGIYDFNDPDDIKDARRDGTMRAKANLSKFLKEKVSSNEGLDEVSKKSKSMTSDGQVQTVAVSKESVKIATESIRNESEAILKGVITLKVQRVPRGNGGEIQVTVGISSKTLEAARRLNDGIDNVPTPPTTSPVVSTPPPTGPITLVTDTDF